MLTGVEKVLFLLRAAVTADASTDALARMASVAEEVEVALGTRLLAVGDTPDALWVVLDGAVRVEGAELPSQLLGPGDLVGGLSLLAGAPCSASAVAVVTTRLLRIERGDLYDLLDEDGEFARALISGLLRARRAASPSSLAT